MLLFSVFKYLKINPFSYEFHHLYAFVPYYLKFYKGLLNYVEIMSMRGIICLMRSFETITEEKQMRQDIVKDLQETQVPVSINSDIKKSDEENLIALQTDYITNLFNTHWTSADESTEPRARD